MRERAAIDLGDGGELRRLRLEDVEALFALVDANRDRLRRRLSWPDLVRTVEDERMWLERVLTDPGQHEQGWAIRDDGSLAGGIGMAIDSLNEVGDIGYWLAEGFEGRGLVTRAADALVRRGFEDLGLHRITIHCAPDNLRSRAVPERLGFTQEAILREAGKTGQGYCDLVVYSLLEPEWRLRA